MSVDNEGGVLLSGLVNRTLDYRNGKFLPIANGQEVPGTIISLAETRDKQIWMGTSQEGLFTVTNGHLRQVPGIGPDEKINVLLPASNGGIWIGTDQGMFFSDRSGLARTSLSASVSRSQIVSMAKDQDRNLWIGTDHGLIRITSSLQVAPLQTGQDFDPQVNAVFEDRDGDIWYGGPRGIQRLRDAAFTPYTSIQGLPPANNGPIYADSAGMTWFAPASGGLYWLDRGQVRHMAKSDLDKDVIYSIDGGDDELWIGRQRGGLTMLSRKGGSFIERTYTQAEGLAQNSIYSVRRCRDGTVWAGTVSAGVSQIRNGVITNYSTASGLSSNTISSTVEGHDGTVWLGTSNGLDAFRDGRWTNRLASDGLPSSHVMTIFEDSKHVLWIATLGGLTSLASGKIVEPHNLPDVLREQIFGIAEDHTGSLWITTSDHVLQVDRDRLFSGALDPSDIRSYGISDGLPGVEGVQRDRSVVADSSGRVWVSLDRGIAVADPKLTPTLIIPVSARIDSISSGGAQINFKDLSNIALASKNVTFTFASTNLSTPARIWFRYKLDGSDATWSQIVANRQVTYSNLSPGTYLFHVMASNSAGLWNGQETSVQFSIKPAFWQTWWFLLSSLSLCLLAVYMLYMIRIRQLASQMDRLFQERLAERTRIAQDLHDTLLQSFQGLMFRFQAVEEMLPNRPDEARQIIAGALDLADQALMEGRDAIKDIRSSPNANQDLAKAMDALLLEVKEETDVGERASPECSVTEAGRSQGVKAVVFGEVLRIAREAMRNAFRHANARQIEVEITYGQPEFRLRLRDDGIGIDPDILKRGRRAGHWGLVGMEERAKRFGGRLEVWSKLGVGTEVELRIPGHIAYQEPAARGMFRLLQRKGTQSNGR
jgi:signal transduction histidine kinase/ligand-binding sensor domain-containing protein